MKSARGRIGFTLLNVASSSMITNGMFGSMNKHGDSLGEEASLQISPRILAGSSYWMSTRCKSGNQQHAHISIQRSASFLQQIESLFVIGRTTMKLFNTLATLTLLALFSQALRTRLFDRLQLQIPSWLRVPTTSKLPLFIHDLRHHWIEENIAWLERRPDPTNDLCVASSALRSGEIEGRAVPADLFDRLDIDNNRAGIN